MPKVLMLAGDAAESLEVMYPYQRLLEAGYEVEIAAPSKKKLQFVVHDFVDGYDTYTEKPGYTWQADLAFADVDPDDYVALVIPGGRAPSTSATTPTCSGSCATSSASPSRSPTCATPRWCWPRRVS
jgi:protease I